MDWLAQGLRKVKFRWNQVSSWQHRILREESLTLVAGFLRLETPALLPAPLSAVASHQPRGGDSRAENG